MLGVALAERIGGEPGNASGLRHDYRDFLSYRPNPALA